MLLCCLGIVLAEIAPVILVYNAERTIAGLAPTEETAAYEIAFPSIASMAGHCAPRSIPPCRASSIT